MANAQLNISYLENGRGGHYLLHSGYKFSIRTRREERVYWRCVNRRCPATVTTHNQIPVKFLYLHNHDSDYIGLAAHAFLNSVKERCQKETRAIPGIFDDELGALRDREYDDTTEEMIRRIPTFHSCKTQLYLARSKTQPKLPTTQADINLEGQWTAHFDICHRLKLAHLCNTTVVLADGTFYSCPGLFSQLYTLHGSILLDAVHQRNLLFSPEVLLLDFEATAQNAVRTVFPRVSLKGCFFHYTQCVWRKTQDCGLAGRYKEDEDLQQLVRRAAVLPLVPAHHVEDVWLHALEDSDDLSPAVTRFKDYITETWVEGRPLQEWNHFDTDGPRTTNNVEGWHSKLNKLTQHAHPNIFALIRLLQTIQGANEVKVIQLDAGGKQRPRQRKYRDIETRLLHLKNRLRSDQIDVTAYADAASHLIHLD